RREVASFGEPADGPARREVVRRVAGRGAGSFRRARFRRRRVPGRDGGRVRRGCLLAVTQRFAMSSKPTPELIAALESALGENPAELATRSALADALLEQDDPVLAARGEFIQTQLALERPELPAEAVQKLQERERLLLDAHARVWLGELAPYLLDQEGV